MIQGVRDRSGRQVGVVIKGQSEEGSLLGLFSILTMVVGR